MSDTLLEIAKHLKGTNKKVQLIYAFNGTGKTRLSREFNKLFEPAELIGSGEEAAEQESINFLYYNAFTEDLFYWDNDLEGYAEPKLKIQANSFTDWILKDQGQDFNVITNFQRYASAKLTPHFNEAFSEVTFSIEGGDDESSGSLKISKGEESNFVWSIFYTLLELVISTLNIPEEDDRDTEQFNRLEYVFIDDPVSSLDENHLIELAVNVASLIKISDSDLKFIITTHNPLFYNVLFNELKSKACYMLERLEDGNFVLNEKSGDSNTSFSYHLYLKKTIEEAIRENKVQRYHFTLLRNLYEKTASFLGYRRWSELLPGDQKAYMNRIMQFTSHSTLSNEVMAQPTEPEKNIVSVLLNHLTENYGYWQQSEQENG